jgi:hypothetical protein
MKQIYTRGLCQPEKGDFGEVMVALYFLLCGDILRKFRNTHTIEYETFSVSLHDWLFLLQSGGRIGGLQSGSKKEESHEQEQSTRVTRGNKAAQSGDHVCQLATVSFIQVCHNYLRSCGPDWEGIEDESFLEYLYESGTAFYVFPGCNTIDLVAPIKIQESTLCKHAPLVVSIKSHYYFSPKEARTECARMEEKATDAGIKSALCLLVVFGSPVNSNDGELALDPKAAVSELCAGKVVSKVLRIPTADAFGLSSAFAELMSHDELAEVFASHSFIRASQGKYLGNALRSLPRTNALGTPSKMLQELSKQLSTANQPGT